MKKIFITGLLLCLSTLIYAQENIAPIDVLIIDYNNNPIKGEQILFVGSETDVTYKGVSNAEGKFTVNVKGGDTYVVKIQNVGVTLDYNKMEIPAAPPGVTYGNLNLTIKITPVKSFTLNNMEYEGGSAKIRAQSLPTLLDLAEFLKRKDDKKIEIGGHTDSQGSDELNLKLSADRAKEVRKFLITQGIDASRLIVKGYGETLPIASNDTVVGRQKNRRTVITILN